MQIQNQQQNFNKTSVFSQFSVPQSYNSQQNSGMAVPEKVLSVDKNITYKNSDAVDVNKTTPNKKLKKTKSLKELVLAYQEIPKGDKKEYISGIKSLTSSSAALMGALMSGTLDIIFSIVAFSFGIMLLQRYVNGKFLINFLDKKFTAKIKDFDRFEDLAVKMRKEHNLQDKVKIFITRGDDAYYTPQGNRVVVGEKQKSALFHELGHAVIENNTSLLSLLQNGRGQYGNIAILLNAISMGTAAKHSKRLDKHKDNKNNKDKNKINKETKKPEPNKLGKFLIKNPYIIPIAAFSPELITEFGASTYGLKFLKKELKTGNVSKKVFKNIKRSYITCFSTYFFIPISVIIVNYLQKQLDKADNIKINRKQREKDYINMLKAAITVPVASAAAAWALSGKQVTHNGKFTNKFLNKICDYIYEQPEKAPEEFKNLHRIYLSNLPVNGKISFTTLLNNPNLEDVIMNRGNERLNAKEVLLEFRSKVSDIMSDFYDFDRNRMIKKKSVSPGYEEELYKYVKNLTKQQKRSFIKRISLKSTGIVIFSMFLFNKFKYLTNKYTKYRENTKQSNIKPEKSKV